MNNIIKSLNINSKIIKKTEINKENYKNTIDYLKGKITFQNLIDGYFIRPFHGLGGLKEEIYKHIITEDLFVKFIELEKFLNEKNTNYVKILDIIDYNSFLEKKAIKNAKKLKLEKEKSRKKVRKKKNSGKNGGFKLAMQKSSPNNSTKFFH